MRANRLVLSAAAALVAATLPIKHARAADYPVRPVRFVIGFSPSGGTDIAGRILAQRLTENLKQTFVVENRTRATPREIVAKLSADSKAALSAKSVEDKLTDMGFAVVASDPAAFTKRMESEYAKWGKVIKQAGIRTR
jgi:tripartite-type tricarboxylate transporter receptor subunit TctC